MKVVAKHHTVQAAPRFRARWLLLPVLAALLAALLFFLGRGPTETLAAESTFYAYGDVPLLGGNVDTGFALRVQEPTVVTDIQTSCMCTQARIVQGDNVSAWYGMSHDASTPKPRIPLEAGVPAYLEVTMDPAAHGPQGVGPVERGIIVRTDGGQELQFVLSANIIP